MLEQIRQALNEFFSQSVQEKWLPFLLLYVLIAIILLIRYSYLSNRELMRKIIMAHEASPNDSEDEDEGESRHFHNTDLVEGDFNTKSTLYKDGFVWIGKHYLFIPNGKINSLTKRFKDLTIWYNGYIAKSFKYKVKHLQRGWEKRRLSKKQITNFNGMFIVGNIMVRTSNLSSLRIDAKNKTDFILTYLFDNGSERIVKMTAPEFFDSMSGTTVPYNVAFLSQCEVIELM